MEVEGGQPGMQGPSDICETLGGPLHLSFVTLKTGQLEISVLPFSLELLEG